MKRVFILGAGFSREAGIPLACQLTDCLVKAAHLNEDDRDKLLRLRAYLGPEATPEHLADAVRLRASFDRLRARAFSPEATTPSTIDFEDPEDVSTRRRQLEEDAERFGRNVPKSLEKNLPSTLLRSHPSDAPKYVESFARQLKKSDCVITFNYDLLVERALDGLNRSYDLGFVGVTRKALPNVKTPRAGAAALYVLKLHGSIDWFAWSKPGEPLQDDKVLYYPTEARDPEDERTWLLIRRPRFDALEDINRPESYAIGRESAIAGLGTFKTVDKVPGLWFVWMTALHHLYWADEVYVVGYSLPPTDQLTRLAFRSVCDTRIHDARGLRRLVVIDPNQIDSEAFERVFCCEVLHRRQKAAQTDWARLS